MKTFPSPRTHRVSAFTLVELVVSMFVLTLLLVMITQMMNSAIAMSANSTKRLDADSQARLALDRMAIDFSQIVKRTDVDYYLHKEGTGQPGMNDQVAFYSETGGYFTPTNVPFSSKSNAALVGYRINNRHLERLNKALIWYGAPQGGNSSSQASAGPLSMTFLPQTLSQTWPTIIADGADSDYQVIGDQVFRMEVSYLVRNATVAATLSDTPYLPNPNSGAATASATPMPTNVSSVYNGLKDVVAFVVTLAVLDDQSRLIVQPTDLDTAAGKLDDSIGTTFANTPAQAWRQRIENGELTAGTSMGGLPKTAASQIRVYERYFYVGNAQ